MPKIDEMWAYIAEDQGPDDEGVVGHQVGDWMFPLVGADKAQMDSLKLVAQSICNTTGKAIKLVKFTQRTDLELLEPRKTLPR